IRQLDENGHFFACTDFRAAGTKDQIYDVDFWISEKDGKMTVDQIKVHKVPEQKNGQWVQVERYSWKDLGNSKVVPERSSNCPRRRVATWQAIAPLPLAGEAVARSAPDAGGTSGKLHSAIPHP